MCLAQGPQCSDADEARTRCPSVSSQALCHLTTALPTASCQKFFCILFLKSIFTFLQFGNGVARTLKKIRTPKGDYWNSRDYFKLHPFSKLELPSKERGSKFFPLRAVPYGVENHFSHISWPPLNVSIFITLVRNCAIGATSMFAIINCFVENKMLTLMHLYIITHIKFITFLQNYQHYNYLILPFLFAFKVKPIYNRNILIGMR